MFDNIIYIPEDTVPTGWDTSINNNRCLTDAWMLIVDGTPILAGTIGHTCLHHNSFNNFDKWNGQPITLDGCKLFPDRNWLNLIDEYVMDSPVQRAAYKLIKSQGI